MRCIQWDGRPATTRPRRCVAALALALAGVATATMQSTKLGPALCETTGGGRFVDVPDFPGELIDRRLLRDVRLLERRYTIFVTDGYSTEPVHAANGEHPIGLALDIVPNKAAGGRWSDIDRLAAWAEPRQDRPRAAVSLGRIRRRPRSRPRPPPAPLLESLGGQAAPPGALGVHGALPPAWRRGTRAAARRRAREPARRRRLRRRHGGRRRLRRQRFRWGRQQAAARPAGDRARRRRPPLNPSDYELTTYAVVNS